MKIIVAPDSFKESISAKAACGAIAKGIRRARPNAEVICVPMADGGEGIVDAMIEATDGRCHESEVTGPLGEPVVARWGILGEKAATAVIEMAAASGLALVPPEQRNPALTTTLGTGELIVKALDRELTRIIVGVGGSATVDGGVGAARALGFVFNDAAGNRLTSCLGGGELDRIARIVPPRHRERLQAIQIEVASDVTNPLCGSNGAAAVFGPQKGATPEQVKILDRNLAHLADLIQRDLGMDVRNLPGAGAAGGLGAGLVAFFGAKLRRGVELVMEAVKLREKIRGADLIITGEGRLDAQSMMGKVIAGVGQAGCEAKVPVVALVGSVGPGADDALQVLDSYHVITPPDMPKAYALREAPALLRKTAADVVRSRFAK